MRLFIIKNMEIEIRNSFCCGFGKPIYRLENWLKHNGYQYTLVRGAGGSQAVYGDKKVTITAVSTVKEIVSALGLEESSTSPQSS